MVGSEREKCCESGQDLLLETSPSLPETTMVEFGCKFFPDFSQFVDAILYPQSLTQFLWPEKKRF